MCTALIALKVLPKSGMIRIFIMRIPLLLGVTLLSLSVFPVKGKDQLPSDAHFQVEELATGLVDAMEITVLPNNHIFIVERTGALKWFNPQSGEVKLVKKFDVAVRKKEVARETGLLGIAADPNFMRNGWLYCFYSPKKTEEHRVSRFTFRAGKLSDEKILLEYAQTRGGNTCHEGGSLAFDADGNLYISSGDNTCPFKSNGFAPIDERRDKLPLNAQRSAGNTNDLRGKILRITPTKEGGYTIPRGNLFPKGTAKTRPEIYVMGCRNPWRIGVDQKTGTVYWGDVGPDSRKDSERGPRGYCEINQAITAGNYGWPYFIADNKAYAHFDFATNETGEKFDPKKPVNQSRLNTGLTDLPPAQEPFWFVGRSCYCAGPIYDYDAKTAAPGALPKVLDRCLITYDWNNGKMQVSKIGSREELVWKKDWLHKKKFVHPADVAIGQDGIMYVLEYSSGWYDGKDGKLLKVTYSETPGEIAQVEKADPRLEGLDPKHPGTVLLGGATCLSCHQTQNKSIGPRYIDVAAKYQNQKGAQELLANKIKNGSVGVWGEVPMPPHGQYNEEQLSQMVDAILSLDAGGHKE